MKSEHHKCTSCWERSSGERTRERNKAVEKVLHLVLKYKYFDQVENGTKTEEYRLYKKFWIHRIEGKKIDKMVLSRGRGGKRLEFPWTGYTVREIVHEEFGEAPVKVFVIPLKGKNNMEISINSVEYSNAPNGPIIHVHGRDAEGNPKHVRVTGAFPYFYVPVSEAAEMKHPKVLHPNFEEEFLSIRGEKLCKIYADTPGDVRDFKDKYTHFEADIFFPVRFLIDKGLTGGMSVPSEFTSCDDVRPAVVNAPTRTCIIDIECNSARGWPDPERDEIICLTCWDSFEDRYVTFLYLPKGEIIETPKDNGCFVPEKHTVCIFRDEKEMLGSFGEYIEYYDPDILTGWNFVLFDLPYIAQRMIALGINTDSISRLPGGERNPIRGRIPFDMLEGYKKMHQAKAESYRLDAIALAEVGRTKTHFTGSISDLWKNNPTLLVEYNHTDVELCVAIEKKNGIVEFYNEVSKYVGCPMDRALNSSSVIDVYVLHRAHGKYVLPSKGVKGEEESFDGAMVFPPVKGVHSNVAVLDLKSLYPMAMVTLNASPETKDPNGDLVAPNGVRFKSSPDGLVRGIVFELLEKRDACKAERNKYPYDSPEYKKLDMQQAVIKIIMNTYYGVSGHSGFRLNDREIGAAITSTGQAILEHNRKIVEREGYKVVMGDTDAVDFKIPETMTREETIAEAKRLEKIMNDSYPEFAKRVLNADKQFFSVKFEKLYERFFSGGRKKRYAGLLVWKEGKDVRDIDVVGFETKRSDSPAITRVTQKTLISMILEGNPFTEVKSFLANVIKKYRKGEYPLDEIGIPGGIGKNLDDYANKDAHARGCEYANKYLGAEFGKGSKPKRIYIKNMLGKYRRTDVLCFEYGDQVPPEFVVDREVMLEKTIRRPLERITEALDWSWMDIDPSYTTLDQWFK